MTHRIAYLGIRGAFSERASRKHFGDDIIDVAVTSFAEIFDAVANDRADYGVLPLENSLAGTVSGSYELLTQYADIHVVGEVILRIRHALMALPGVSLSDVRFARSHPQALAQSAQFLKAHHIEPVNWYNTAGSAKDLADDQLTDTAAIASPDVANIYGLTVLANDIQDIDDNYTRFLIISKQGLTVGQGNKTSLIFTTAHKPGALVDCLQCISDAGLNLTKIESRPLRSTPWEYIFYVDFTTDLGADAVNATLTELAQHATMVRVLGSYTMADD